MAASEEEADYKDAGYIVIAAPTNYDSMLTGMIHVLIM